HIVCFLVCFDWLRGRLPALPMIPTDREPGPSSLSNGDKGRPSDYLSNGKKRKADEKEFMTDYGSDAEKSDDNLVVDEREKSSTPGMKPGTPMSQEGSTPGPSVPPQFRPVPGKTGVDPLGKILLS
ncbi:hypothetical protein cypCar_00008403, partial [Cyprinus carpio]